MPTKKIQSAKTEPAVETALTMEISRLKQGIKSMSERLTYWEKEDAENNDIPQFKKWILEYQSKLRELGDTSEPLEIDAEIVEQPLPKDESEE